MVWHNFKLVNFPAFLQGNELYHAFNALFQVQPVQERIGIFYLPHKVEAILAN
jgi:hypothetical protein